MIFLIVGWVKTIEQYFQQQTKPSLSATVEFLSNNPKAKFIYAEMSFLSMWWQVASTDERSKLKKLLDSGQMEIVSGGWVMNDEANTHFFAMIDQLTEGHQWLAQNLDYRPNASWAIDPFGHSTTMAYLVNRMGIDRMLIQRTHYEVKKYLASNKKLEYRWTQPWDVQGDTDVLCHMMPFYSYDIPHTCGPDPKICCSYDFARSDYEKCPWGEHPVATDESNVDSRARNLLDQYKKKAMLYQRHNVVLVPLGDDFRYRSINEWQLQYDNLQKIFDHINASPDLHANVRFGTLSDYFTEIETRSKKLAIKFPSLSGDMFTYSDRVTDYWSGYFTSRPFHKRLSRVLEKEIYTADILYSLALHRKAQSASQLKGALFEKLTDARQQLGVFQHHDGITGTAKSFVVDDYGLRMLRALDQCREVIATSAITLLESKTQMIPLFEVWDKNTEPQNPNVEAPLDSSTMHFYIFNPTWQTRSSVFRLNLKTKKSIKNMKATAQSTQIPVSFSKNQIGYEVVIGPIPGIRGWAFILVKLELEAVDGVGECFSKPVESAQEIHMENDFWHLEFDPKSHLLKLVTNKQTGEQYGLKLTLQTFPSQNSGAYLFAPSGEPIDYQFSTKVTFNLRECAGFSELAISDQMFQHKVRLYKGGDPQQLAIEIENLLFLKSDSAVEFAMKIETSIQNENQEIFTDSNCLQFVRRVYNRKIPLQGNVFPMSCAAYIEDKNQNRFSILSGQPLGVAALQQGAINLFLDRLMTKDDKRGLGTPIADTRPTRSVFRLMFEKVSQPPASMDRNKWIPGLTERAENVLHDILRPAIALYHNSTDAKINELLLLPNDIPKDLQLINLKTFPSSSKLTQTYSTPIASQLGMVVRRLAPFPTNEHDETTQSDQTLSVASLKLALPNLSGFYPSSITLLPEIGKQTMQEITVKKHNLVSVLLHISSP
ncbi:Alpha-mannosidase 2 [Cichlidogyrus casuarinus]|uniref:mannosyl-oligosaccharide 1,3-1,6-alpha-mannosidase n=1 Tax=Cichlidogyrus casuarinus TaxID=1844966 RepID=A0ABD2PYX3_9PLAT